MTSAISKNSRSSIFFTVLEGRAAVGLNGPRAEMAGCIGSALVSGITEVSESKPPPTTEVEGVNVGRPCMALG